MSSLASSSLSSSESADDSVQTFAATSFDICQVVRSKKPPLNANKMELVCDGFEVIRTKDKTGYEACLKRLEKARAELNGKLSSDKRAVLSYDEYVKAHQNIRHERVSEKSKQMEKLKMKKLKQKLQRYQTHLHEIDEMKSLDAEDTHQEEKRRDTEDKIKSCQIKLAALKPSDVSLSRSRSDNSRASLGSQHNGRSIRTKGSFAPEVNMKPQKIKANPRPTRGEEAQDSWCIVPKFFTESERPIIYSHAMSRMPIEYGKHRNRAFIKPPHEVSIPSKVQSKVSELEHADVHSSSSSTDSSLSLDSCVPDIEYHAPEKKENETSKSKTIDAVHKDDVSKCIVSNSKDTSYEFYKAKQRSRSYSVSNYTTESSSMTSKSFRLKRSSRDALRKTAEEILSRSKDSDHVSYCSSITRSVRLNSHGKIAPSSNVSTRSISNSTTQSNESRNDHGKSSQSQNDGRDAASVSRSLQISANDISMIDSDMHESSNDLPSTHRNNYDYVKKNLTGMQSHTDSTIVTASIHGNPMDNIHITFDSETTGDSGQSQELESTGSHVQMYQSTDDVFVSSSLEELQSCTRANDAPMSAFVGLQVGP